MDDLRPLLSASVMGMALWEALWDRLPAGGWIALCALLPCVLLGWGMVFRRWWRITAPYLREMPQRRARKKVTSRWKFLGVVALAVLPGGLVGSAAVLLLVGKKDWRADAWRIQWAALPLGLLLVAVAWSRFPWPALADGLFVNGLLGLIFGLLQFWATIKMVREAWFEAEPKARWWPPLALWVQTAMLAGAVVLVWPEGVAELLAT